MEELAKVSGERNTYSNTNYAGTGGVSKTYNLADYMNKTATEATQYKSQSGGILAQTELVTADTLGLNNIGDALDSNTTAQTKQAQARWAQQTKLSSDGGTVEVYDKVDQYTNGEQDTYANTRPTIVGSIASGLASAMTMLSLGKTIAGAFYDLNPTVWDDAGFDLMDPDKWEDNLIEAPNGKPSFSDLAVMTLLQFDYKGKSAFQYISEDVMALVARGLAKIGLLDTKASGEGDARDVDSLAPTVSVSGDIEFHNILKNLTVYTIPASTTVIFDFNNKADTETKTKGAAFKIENNTDAEAIASFITYTDDNGIKRITPIALLDANYSSPALNSLKWSYATVWLNGAYRWSTSLYCGTINLAAYANQYPAGTWPTGATEVAYIGATSLALLLDDSYTTDLVASAAKDGVSAYDSNFLDTIFWEMLKAAGKSSLPDGIGDQDGATQLTESEVAELKSDSTTNERALEILKGRFTDLWQNRLETNTVQADGTVKKTTWINTGSPNEIDVNGNGMVIPDSSKGTAGSLQASKEITYDPAQLNPGETVDPGKSTAPSVLNSILNSFRPNSSVESDPSGDAAPAPDPAEEYQEPTDTTPSKPGVGVTPPVVIPSGSGGALFTVYNPSETEIQAFGAWMWSSDLIDQLKKLFSDPMQAVIGLHKVFIPPLQGGESTIQVGYLDSGVTSTVVRQQYSQVNCGSVDVPEFFGNVFDYAPHTRIQLYLPFIGIVDLDPADVMRSTITVKYVGDSYTGACIANVYVKRDGNDCCLYTFNGDTAVRYPISSGSYLGLASGVIGTVTSLAVAATNPIFGAAGVINSIGSMRTNVKHAGNLGGAPGAMGIKYPYLIITRPQTATATNFQKYVGKPANVLALVSQCSGFTRIEGCQVSNINEATEEEKAEIEKLLSSGFLA